MRNFHSIVPQFVLVQIKKGACEGSFFLLRQFHVPYISVLRQFHVPYISVLRQFHVPYISVLRQFHVPYPATCICRNSSC